MIRNMKKKVLLLTALVAPMLTMSAAKIKIDRIEPTDWFVGMKNPTVQLMVYGQGIRDVKVRRGDYRDCAAVLGSGGRR